MSHSIQSAVSAFSGTTHSGSYRKGVRPRRLAVWSGLLFWGGLLSGAMFASPQVWAQSVMHVPTSTDSKAAPKSELAPEPTGSETPSTLRIVLALALGAAVVAVVCVPSRKGGGDER